MKKSASFCTKFQTKYYTLAYLERNILDITFPFVKKDLLHLRIVRTKHKTGNQAYNSLCLENSDN